MNYLRLPSFESAETVHVVVESPRGSTVKLKYDPTLEAFGLSRPLAEGLVYPYDWGFVPSTRASDGDPLDVMVVWDRPSFPGVVLRCRLLGVVAAEQNNKHHPERRERNDRLIAVPVEAPRQAAIERVDDLPVRLREELESFFLATVAFENKDLTFRGWSGVEAAYDLVRSCLVSADTERIGTKTSA
jgi:inorganic pyrophosphatase